MVASVGGGGGGGAGRGACAPFCPPLPVRDLYFLLRESEVWGILHYFAYCGS